LIALYSFFVRKTKILPVLVLFSGRCHSVNAAAGKILRRKRAFRLFAKIRKIRKTPPVGAVRCLFSGLNEFFSEKMGINKNNVYICSPKTTVFGSTHGKMPEWSIGPHSKCGVRVTVPGVRIPLFPQQTLKISRLQNKHPVLHPRM
jgi:hypothetical protein